MKSKNDANTTTANNSTDSAKHLLRNILLPASVTYGAGAYVRILAYAGGVLKRYKAPVPIVSVGNLTVGGTGKTPVAINLARKFVAAGFRPAVLSRGYKRKSTDPYVVVSDGDDILASCEDAGDEPYLIALSVKGAVVIVGPKRSETAEIACNRFGCNLIILDDGFQHLAVQRDADIVLIDYNDDIEHDLLIPAGRLREPLAALARASSVVITKVPPEADRARLERLSEIVHKFNPKASIGLIRFTTTRLVAFEKNKGPGFSLLTDLNMNQKPQRVVAFCGLARPERFFDGLDSQSFTVVSKVALPDHHWYTASDATKFNDLAQKFNADGFITTEKDIVKFVELKHQLNKPLFALGLSTSWVGTLPTAVEELLAAGPPNLKGV